VQLLTDARRFTVLVLAGVLALNTVSLVLRLLALRWDVSVIDPDDIGPGGFPAFSVLLRQFSTDIEGNVPTWSNAALMLVAALLAWGVSIQARLAAGPWRRHWAVLAAAFAYLSLDEATGLHERTIPYVADVVGTGDLTNAGWGLVAGPITAVLALIYIPFLRGMPARTGRLLVAAGAIYLSGALGMEVVGALSLDVEELGDGFAYVLASTVEELLEMLGVTVLLYAVLTYRASEVLPRQVHRADDVVPVLGR
jgi:hypothetical protein